PPRALLVEGAETQLRALRLPRPDLPLQRRRHAGRHAPAAFQSHLRARRLQTRPPAGPRAEAQRLPRPALPLGALTRQSLLGVAHAKTRYRHPADGPLRDDLEPADCRGEPVGGALRDGARVIARTSTCRRSEQTLVAATMQPVSTYQWPFIEAPIAAHRALRLPVLNAVAQLSRQTGKRLLGSTLPLPIPQVMPGQRKRRQPGLAPDDPAFVGRQQLIGRVQRAQVHLDFIAAAGEHRGAAARAEGATGVVAGFAFNVHRALGRDRRG